MLRAIIFDCDGVIADTEPIHMDALVRVLAGEGISLTKEEYFAEYLALDDRACFTRALSMERFPDAKERVDELIRRKSLYVDKIIAEGVQILPGVSELIRAASSHYPLAIASGALRREIESIVRNAGLNHFFRVIVSAEDVTRCKPFPDPFLKALNLFNKCLNESISPEECLVIEDSIHGIRAAHLASMRCLAVANSYPKDKLADADLIVDTLEGLSLNELKTLFS